MCKKLPQIWYPLNVQPKYWQFTNKTMLLCGLFVYAYYANSQTFHGAFANKICAGLYIKINICFNFVALCKNKSIESWLIVYIQNV